MRNAATPRQTTPDASSTPEGKPASNARSANQSRQTTSINKYQPLVMPGMVTLGCLGLAFSFSFFSTDPNHFLFGGIAALMAIMWAYSFWIRLRKIRQSV